MTIYHGDCREVLPQLDVKVDLVLTDPPYEMRGEKCQSKGMALLRAIRSQINRRTLGIFLHWIELLKSLSPSQIAIHCNSYMIGQICYLIEQWMKPVCFFTWYKRNAPPNIRNTPKFDCQFITWHKSESTTNKNARLFRSKVVDIPFW